MGKVRWNGQGFESLGAVTTAMAANPAAAATTAQPRAVRTDAEPMTEDAEQLADAEAFAVMMENPVHAQQLTDTGRLWRGLEVTTDAAQLTGTVTRNSSLERRFRSALDDAHREWQSRHRVVAKVGGASSAAPGGIRFATAATPGGAATRHSQQPPPQFTRLQQHLEEQQLQRPTNHRRSGEVAPTREAPEVVRAAAHAAAESLCKVVRAAAHAAAAEWCESLEQTGDEADEIDEANEADEPAMQLNAQPLSALPRGVAHDVTPVLEDASVRDHILS